MGLLLSLVVPANLLAVESRAESPVPHRGVRPVSLANTPNIVVLMLDDHAFMDHRVWDRLPNIKALFIDQGIEALNYWGNDPLCCPGRANFLTAQVAHVNGVVRNDARLLDPRETIATELHDLGYYTNICGKYLNGTRNLADKSPDSWDNVAISEGLYYGYSAYVNDVEEPHGTTPADYSTDVFANDCLQFLEEAPVDRPVFLFMTPYATHFGPDADGLAYGYEPVPAPRHSDDARCAGIPPWKPVNYNSASLKGKPEYVKQRPLLGPGFEDGYPLEKRCRALLSVDEWLGSIVAELTTQGRYDNTLFVLTGDNGMGYGAFRWEIKIAPHTAQMPLFVTWPSVVTGAPRQIGHLLSNVDLAPTLCEFAGCEMGPYPNGLPPDGESFAGLIAPGLSSSTPQRTAIILESLRGRSVPEWRAIMTDPAHHTTGKQWFSIVYSNGAKELYNLSGGPCYAWTQGMTGDPCMLKNLAKARPKLRGKLNAELAASW